LNNFKTVEVKTGSNDVQTIGMGFNQKFESGGSGEMDLSH